MSYRRLIFANNEVYHIFNKSVANEQIFLRKKDAERVLSLFDYYRYFPIRRYSFFIRLKENIREITRERMQSMPALVEILTFAMMPNHYHFLVKQTSDNGISLFISNFQNSFARYFNIKKNRKGALFCEMFKAVRIETNEQLIHVSRYIHLNPVSSYLIEIDELENYPYTSFGNFIGQKTHNFVNTDLILSSFKNSQKYKEFVLNYADYQRRLEEIKHLSLE